MFSKYLDQFNEVLNSTEASNHLGENVELNASFEELNGFLKELRNKGSRVYLVGNGGSSGIVSHGAIDFLNACGFKALALTDNSMLTCLANDYGYENVFSQALKTQMEEGDVLIAISSSGNSQNIVNACHAAKEKKASIVTLSGFSSDNKLRKCGDYNFWVDSKHYGRVEIGHSLILHYITDHLAIK